MNENGNAPSLLYVALGDSTGVGVGARRDGGYVARLFTRLESLSPPARLVNLCVSGATTIDVLRFQVARAVEADPSLVTLGIGINDIGRGLSAEQFASNYEAIISRLKQRESLPVVVSNIPDISTAPAIPSFMREEARRRIRLFNEEIDRLVERFGLSLVNVYHLSHELIPVRPDFFSADGFHPSDAGYEFWAETMWPAVERAARSALAS